MKKSLLTLLFTIFITISGFSQISPNKADDYIKEFFGPNYQRLLQNEPQRILSYKQLLTKRIEFIKEKEQDDEKFVKISTLDLFNNFNSDLKRDLKFSIETFNPLKYAMPFFNLRTSVYRLDGTDWLIKINAQNIK